MAYSVNKAQTTNNDKRTGSHIYPGTFLAEVMHNRDPQKAGRLWVYISEFGYDKTDPSSWIAVSYASPFYGISPHTAPQPQATGGQSIFTSNNPADQAATGSAGQQPQQEQPVTTYGFWAIPPDVGVKVLCTFVEGNLTYGYWYAVVPTISHSMIPAMGAPDGKSPVMDINPLSPNIPITEDLDSLQRQPYEPLTSQFSAQGIQEDPLRGPITSSSFRESPSKVFGISSQVSPTNPGHTFVMDDGDAEGKNKLIRLRTANGSQITMHDDTGMIYLINAGGTGWLEISPSGHIDVYGEAGINLATPKSINLHATENVNIHAGNCVKIVGMNGTKVMGGKELQLHGAKTMIEGVDSLHVHTCGEMMITSFGDIHMKAFNYFCLKGKCFYWNSCTAKEAEQVPPEQPSQVSGYDTTVERAPSREPYKEHDSGQGAGVGGGGETPTAPDGSASGTGAGGMFDGNATPAMDTKGTSLGNNYTLPFNQGASYPNIPNIELRTTTGSVAGGQGIVPQNSLTTGGTAAVIGGGGVMATRPATLTASQTSNIINAKRTQTITQPTNSTLANISTGAGTNSLGKSSSGSTLYQTSYNAPNAMVGSSGSLNVTTPQGTLTTSQPTAVQGQDIFTSSNPADQLATNPRNLTSNPANTGPGSNPTSQPSRTEPSATPAQAASNALGQMGGMTPSTDLPAAAGGGGTGCFATGDNCDRPVDETGGGGGPGGSEDQSGQSAGDIPSDATDEEIAARTIAGECRGCSPEEQAAIGEVLRNRAAANGTSVAYEARKAYQFSTWNAGDPNRSYITNLSKDSSTYQTALNAYKSSASTNYTYGATHYYNARTVSPSWGSSMTSTKSYGSGHRFGYIKGEYGK